MCAYIYHLNVISSDKWIFKKHNKPRDRHYYFPVDTKPAKRMYDVPIFRSYVSFFSAMTAAVLLKNILHLGFTRDTINFFLSTRHILLNVPAWGGSFGKQLSEPFLSSQWWVVGFGFIFMFIL